MTAGEIAVRRKEESGFVKDILAPFKTLWSFDLTFYQLFMECEIIGGHPQPGLETSAAEFFKRKNYLNYPREE